MRSGLLAGAGLAFGPSFYRSAFAAAPAAPGPSPYGPLQAPDANGIQLPQGFGSREIARGGQVVADTGYVWHTATDGQACFAAPDGGWILTANSEVSAGGGGVSAVRFAPNGSIADAYRILDGTTRNCAGGPTPWGTWLSCEEEFFGQVWECDPTGAAAAVARPAMGLFSHEAACVDPEREVVYMTEDQGDGLFYRFVPDSYPELSSGRLECAALAPDGAVTWIGLPVPGFAPPTRNVGATLGAATFDGGEGIWFDSGVAYFTTKGDNKLWAYDARASRLDVLYDAAAIGPDAPLTGVDNVTVHAHSGDIYVCEDGGDLDVCIITPERRIDRFLKLDPAGHSSTELVGVVFDPAGTRMYVGSQRSFERAGVVYEIVGPFRRPTAGGGLPPQLRVRVPARIRRRRLAEDGLTVRLELPSLQSVKVELRLPLRSPGQRRVRRELTIAKAATPVPVAGATALRLTPGSRGMRLLRRRPPPARAIVWIELTDQLGRRRVIRRAVRFPGARRRR